MNAEETFCDSLEDVPPMGLWFTRKPALVLPPYRFDLIAAAYCAACWRWAMNSEERLEFWKGRPSKGSIQDYLLELDTGILPSPSRVKKTIETMFADLGTAEYCEGGGLIVFRSKSGRLGLGIDDLLGDHLRRIKAERKEAGLE